MKPIWNKSHIEIKHDKNIHQFLAGQDVILDRALLVYDIQASIAHVNGLARIKILTHNEAEIINQCLNELLSEFQDGNFILDDRYEDGHSAIEIYATEKLGDLGKKIHTGRSRNDQVSVAIRLYLIDCIDLLSQLTKEIIQAFLVQAERHENTAMPGYTHLQRAMPSSVGFWFAGLAESFLENLEVLIFTRSWLNKNPLGTASGFGINLELDRDGVSSELGFTDLQLNPQAVQNSRGKVEIQAIHALSLCTLDLRRFAWDMSLFMSNEFGFLDLPDEYVTGSSIMPNKRNPDVVELLRAVHSGIEASLLEINGLLSLPSSYHRDLQNTKPPLIRAFNKGIEAFSLLPNLINSIQINSEKMHKAIDAEMLATDIAVNTVKSGISFRDAYQEAMQNIQTVDSDLVKQSLHERVSLGAPGNLALERLYSRFEQLLARLK